MSSCKLCIALCPNLCYKAAAFYCYVPSGSFHVGETGILMAGCLLSVLISRLILCLVLEDQSGLTSEFKDKRIPSFGSLY